MFLSPEKTPTEKPVTSSMYLACCGEQQQQQQLKEGFLAGKQRESLSTKTQVSEVVQYPGHH